MANKTINGLTVTTSAASSDLVPIWVAGSGVTRKITKANFMGGILTGGGTIATGGNTLTITGGSPVLSGGGTITTNGYNLTISGGSPTVNGGGTISLGGYTLTVPGTGTAALVSNGTWTPDLKFGGANVGLTYTLRWGLYTKIDNFCFIEGGFILSSKGSSTGAARVFGLPFVAKAVTNAYPPVTIQWLAMSSNLVAGSGTVYTGQTYFDVNGATAATLGLAALNDTAFGNSSELRFSFGYLTE